MSTMAMSAFDNRNHNRCEMIMRKKDTTAGIKNSRGELITRPYNKGRGIQGW